MNQNEVRKAIMDGSSQEDQALFTSLSMEEFFNTFIAGVTTLCESQIKVHLNWEDSDRVAFASNRNEVTLNCGCSMLKDKTRRDRFVYLKGLALHECGHLLWTDYWLLKNKIQQFKNCALLDPDPQILESKEVLLYLKKTPETLSPLLSLLKTIDNSVEDGYIEYKLVNLCGGYSKNLMILRDWQSSTFESWQQMKAAGLNDGVILLNSILAFAKYHKDLQDDEQNLELNQVYEDIKELILKAVHEDVCEQRSLYINSIFAKVSYYLLNDLMKDTSNQSEQSQKNSNRREEQGKSSESLSGSPDVQSSPETSNGNGAGEKSQKSMSQNISKMLQSIADNASTVNADEGERRLQSSVEIKSTKTINQRDIPNHNVCDTTASQELENIARQECRRIKQQEREKEILAQLNRMSTQVSDCNIQVNVKRATIGDPALYAGIKKRVEPVVKKLTKELLQKVESKRYGENERHLFSGTSIDVAGFLQRDGKAFSKKHLPEALPDFCVSVLIDESGSMQGLKEDTAKVTALAIYGFCHNLHIPVSVYGHNVSSGCVQVVSYADFNSIDGQDPLRIANTCSRGSNRDGAAIKFVAQHMLAQQSDTNIMIIISDGRPSYYHSKDEALTEMHQVISEYSKKGIMIIAAGIADDNNDLRQYYEEGISKRYCAKFLDISDLSAMPKRFVKMLATHIEKQM